MSHSKSLAYDVDIITGKRLTAVIGVLFFILATALGAYVRIPVPGSPVPITLQTFFVLLSGAILGARLGLISQVGYLLLGVLGVPVFQGAAFGIAGLLGPTGGYIIGFAFAAVLVGASMRHERPGILRIVTAFSLGSLAIYAFGAAWLIYVYKMPPAGAISLGILPFVPGDIVKVCTATAIYSSISCRAKSIFSE